MKTTKTEITAAGKRVGARLRMMGEVMTADRTNAEKIEFWSAIMDEVLEAFEECTQTDIASHTRH